MTNDRNFLVERVFRRILMESSAADNLAVWILSTKGGGKAATLYRPEELMNILEVFVDPRIPERLPSEYDMVNILLRNNCIAGYIDVGPSSSPCNGAWQVDLAAGKGLGKTLYSVGYAMTPNNRLVSDRKSVSRSAYAAWSKASTKLKSLPLDDVTNPQTPSPDDDCFLHKGTDTDCGMARGSDPARPMRDPEVLNRAYEGPPDSRELLSRLQAAHVSTMKEVENIYTSDKLIELLEKSMGLAGEEYFWKNYRGHGG